MARALDVGTRRRDASRMPYENGYGTSLPRSNYKDMDSVR
jgi:hypothetical protein